MSSAPPRHAVARHLRVWQDPTDPDGDAIEDARAPRQPERVSAEPDADATTAVVAHGLLGNLAVVRGVARLLINEPALGEPERSNLLAMLDTQVDLMQGVLTDLIRGMPSQALAALDELRR